MRSTNFRAKILSFYFQHICPLQVSPRGDIEGVVFLGLAAARCSVAVLEKASPYPTFTPIYLYIFIYRYIDLKFDLQTIRFRTATPQRRNSESRAKLAWAMPSTSGVDEVSRCNTSRQDTLSAKNQRIIWKNQKNSLFLQQKIIEDCI